MNLQTLLTFWLPVGGAVLFCVVAVGLFLAWVVEMQAAANKRRELELEARKLAVEEQKLQRATQQTPAPASSVDRRITLNRRNGVSNDAH